MATTITAYRYEREYPTGRRNEYETVTEYSLTNPVLYPAQTIHVELIGQATRLGAYGQASVNTRGMEDAADRPCILVDLGGGVNRGYTAYSLEEAIEMGHARIVA